jgi:hypothetical protein
MSDLIDIPAALDASPRPCAPVFGALRRLDDAQPRLTARSSMPTAFAAWRGVTGSTTRGFETAAKPGTQDGRTAIAGAAFVTTKHHYSTRSGPPTSRPPA